MSVGFLLSLSVVFPGVFLAFAAVLSVEASRNKGLSMWFGVAGGLWSGVVFGGGGFPDTGLVFGCCKGHMPNDGKTQEKHARNYAETADQATMPSADTTTMPPEYNGPKGPEPTRYGDWEQKGRCTDF